MKLAQLTDCHLFADKDKCGYNDINPFSSLQLLLNQLRVINPDKLLVTGDISGDGSKQSYQHFLSLVEDVGMLDKLHTIPGNHDNASMYCSFLGAYDLCSTSLKTTSNWHIHGVNTMYKGTLGKINELDLVHLSNKVEQSPNHHHLVCCHHHPLDCGGWMDNHNWINKHEFTQLVECHKNIKAVLYGHIHTASEIQIEHCRYLCAPSSCWQWANSKDFGLTNERPGMRIIELHKDGKLLTSIRRLNEKTK